MTIKDFEIVQGDKAVYIVDTSIPNLSGYTVKFVLKNNITDNDAILEVTGVNDENELSKSIITLSSSDTLTLNTGTYIYGVKIIDPNNDTISLLRGNFKVRYKI